MGSGRRLSGDGLSQKCDSEVCAAAESHGDEINGKEKYRCLCQPFLFGCHNVEGLIKKPSCVCVLKLFPATVTCARPSSCTSNEVISGQPLHCKMNFLRQTVRFCDRNGVIFKKALTVCVSSVRWKLLRYADEESRDRTKHWKWEKKNPKRADRPLKHAACRDLRQHFSLGKFSSCFFFSKLHNCGG